MNGEGDRGESRMLLRRKPVVTCPEEASGGAVVTTSVLPLTHRP